MPSFFCFIPEFEIAVFKVIAVNSLSYAQTKKCYCKATQNKIKSVARSQTNGWIANFLKFII